MLRIIPAIAGLALMFGSASALGEQFAAPASAAIRCHEDQACWSWSTMGNHKRGVVTMAGNRRIVGPCQFERLVREHWIDLRGQRMKGDAWAIDHGCAKAHFDALERS